MSLEEELREKIKQAREEQSALESTEEVATVEDEPVQEEEEVKEVEDVNDVDDTPVEKEEVAEEEVEDADLKSTKPDAKKFAHMRKEAKERARENQELRERLARLEGAQEARTQPEAPVVVEEIPDRELDPEAYIDYIVNNSNKKIEALSTKIELSTEQAASVQREQLYKDLENKYSETDPGYKEAKSYLMKAQASELMDAHPNATDAEIKQELKRREYTLVQNLAQAGSGVDEIFGTLKAQALAKGYREITTKKDNTKLKRNIKKSASLNDAPSGDAQFGYSESQLARMKPRDFHKLANDPKNLKKAETALRAARIKAMG